MLDCIIIGAGFSGIAAGRILHQQGKLFRVLEARDRIGGRVFTKNFEGFYLDLGGQWIGPTQTRMYALAEAYGVEHFKTYNKGKHTLHLGNSLKTYKGLIPNTDILTLLNLELLTRLLQHKAKALDKQHPYQHPKAQIYDRISLWDYVQQYTFTNNARKVIKAAMETVFATDLKTVSLLHALFYIQSGSSLENLISIDEGAQQDRLAGGMQVLAAKMLQPFQEHLSLSSAVKSVTKKEGCYEVKTPTQTLLAKTVIAAIPPHLLQEIEFSPPLSHHKSELIQKLPMGSVAKCFCIYSKPFWRQDDFSGQVIADEGSPFQVIFDASPRDASKGILLGFCIADRYEAFFSLTEEERKTKMLEQLRKYFGEKAMAVENYVDFTMKDEHWSGGCYAAVYGQEIWTKYQHALKTPEGGIFFAGTETSDVWYGYIEGAVRAGERAANEVLERV